jgi:hypothetical protein
VTHAEAKSDVRKKSVASWLGLAALGAALAAIFAVASWCAANWELVCFRKEAFLWRNGYKDTWLSNEWGHLYAIDRYMQAHWQDLTEDDVRGLLGDPTFTIDIGYVEYHYSVPGGYSVMQPDPEDLARGWYPPSLFQVRSWTDAWPDDVDVHLGVPENAGMNYLQRSSTEAGDFDWVQIHEWMEELGLPVDGTEHVIWYDYCEPGNMHVGDETYNIYFFIRDGKVLRYYTLAP